MPRLMIVCLGLLLSTVAQAETTADAVPQLQARIAELETLLKESDEELGRERQKVNGLSGKALDLEKQLQEALARIAELEAQLAALREQLEQAQIELSTEKKLAAERIADRDERIAELEAQLAEARARISHIEIQIGTQQALSEAQTRQLSEKEALIARLRKDNATLQASIEATKGALAELEKRKAAADARIAEFRALIEKFKSLIDAGRLRVKIVEGRMVVELATDILFRSGSATLSRAGRTSLQEVAAILTSIPDRKFQIEGHTDNVPISTATFPSNWELASARAITVVKTMLQAGMPEQRISAASYSDVRPAVPNDTKEGRAANRRIEIVVVPDLSTLPGFDELNQVASTPAP